jgi:hypothetical protein
LDDETHHIVSGGLPIEALHMAAGHAVERIDEVGVAPRPTRGTRTYSPAIRRPTMRSERAKTSVRRGGRQPRGEARRRARDGRLRPRGATAAACSRCAACAWILRSAPRSRWRSGRVLRGPRPRWARDPPWCATGRAPPTPGGAAGPRRRPRPARRRRGGAAGAPPRPASPRRRPAAPAPCRRRSTVRRTSASSRRHSSSTWRRRAGEASPGDQHHSARRTSAWALSPS